MSSVIPVIDHHKEESVGRHQYPLWNGIWRSTLGRKENRVVLRLMRRDRWQQNQGSNQKRDKRLHSDRYGPEGIKMTDFQYR